MKEGKGKNGVRSIKQPCPYTSKLFTARHTILASFFFTVMSAVSGTLLYDSVHTSMREIIGLQGLSF